MLLSRTIIASNAYYDKVFGIQLFYQIQKSSDKYQQGMGLGLVLVKKMVILHQGNVHIKSVFKKGTVLMIDFPKERLIFDGR